MLFSPRANLQAMRQNGHACHDSLLQQREKKIKQYSVATHTQTNKRKV
jgi:hypothetical protein